MADFNSKIALVTGAGTGMGKATAELLAARGAKVAILGIERAPIEAVAHGIEEKGGAALALAVDVGDAKAVEAAVKTITGHWGGLHLAVNNAGISGVSAPVGDLEPEDWHRVNAVNYDGVFYGLRYQVPAIETSGGGSIVIVSSMFWNRGLPTRVGYTAAKHGVVGLARAAAIDYGPRGIRVNVVAPGVIDTPMLDSGRAQSEAVAATVPMRRMGQSSEIATAVAFLLSDEASYITGTVLGVDGGINA